MRIVTGSSAENDKAEQSIKIAVNSRLITPEVYGRADVWRLLKTLDPHRFEGFCLQIGLNRL